MNKSLRLLLAAGFALATATTTAHARVGDQPAYPAMPGSIHGGAPGDVPAAASVAATAGATAATTASRHTTAAEPMASAGEPARARAPARSMPGDPGAQGGSHLGRPIIPGA